MTDRIKGLTVTLKDNLREDDTRGIVKAIQLIRGVINVTSHVADMDHYMAVETARIELKKKIWIALNDSVEVEL